MTRRGPDAGSDLSDALLVLRVQSGDPRAFEQLYRRFGPGTWRYVRGLLTDAADDIHQEVWLTVYQKISTLANPARFKAWLFQIARRRAIDWTRARNSATRAAAVLAAEAHDEATPPASEASDFEEPLGISTETLDAAMAELSPAHRDVLTLRYFETLSYADIARVMDCSIGTVRSRLHHAKKALHTRLADDPHTTTEETIS